MKKIFDGNVFEKYSISEGLNHEFNECTFQNCDFSNAPFGAAELVECTFVSCNLAMAKFDNTMLNQVKFINCKVQGVDFSKCSKFLFSVSFENCLLNYSLFYKNELKGTIFKNCIIHEASMIESNLTSSIFSECDLERTVFDRTNLEKADFSTSRNYTINPNNNKLKKTKFSMPEVTGLLDHLDIIITG
jgi:fluoroquinolone resistance protein